MAKKIIYKRITTVLLLLFTIQALVITPVTPKSTNNEQVSVNVWKLIDWNEANTTQWYSKGIFVQAQKGSQVAYNITSSQKNETYPNSGYFSIGNASNIQTDNNDLANTFTLSIYPWSPGFVTNPTNWTQNEASAGAAAAGTYLQGHLSITNGLTYNFSKYQRIANEFVYSQNLTLGNQNTTLIYDRDTGVLLYAKSEIFFSALFKIVLELQSSTLIISSNTSTNQTTTTPSFTFVMPLLVVSSLFFVKKRKKNNY